MRVGHLSLEVSPASLGEFDISSGHGATVLAEDVEQHEEIVRAPVEDPIEHATAMTPKLTEAGFDLRGLRERKRRCVVWEAVHFVDLFFDV